MELYGSTPLSMFPVHRQEEGRHGRSMSSSASSSASGYKSSASASASSNTATVHHAPAATPSQMAALAATCAAPTASKGSCNVEEIFLKTVALLQGAFTLPTSFQELDGIEKQGAPAVGFRNSGVHCYINAAVQVLFGSSRFIKHVLALFRQILCARHCVSVKQGMLVFATVSLLCAMQQRGVSAAKTGTVAPIAHFTPSLLTAVKGSDGKPGRDFINVISGRDQSDAGEWLVLFLNLAFENQALDTMFFQKKRESSLYKAGDTSMPHACTNDILLPKPRESMPLAILQVTSGARTQNLKDLLDNHFKCKLVTTDTGQRRFEKNDANCDVLLVYINRFLHTQPAQIIQVSVPETWSPPDMVPAKTFVLKSAAYKSGTQFGGHWRTCRRISEKWYNLNDSRVTECTSPYADRGDDAAKQVTLLLYETAASA